MQDILINYYKDQSRLHWIFCGILLLIFLGGYLIFRFGKHPIYPTFSKVILIASPILLLRYFYQIVELRASLRNLTGTDILEISAAREQLDKRQGEIKGHIKVLSWLLVLLIVALLPGCLFFNSKMVISLAIGFFLLFSMEYIFQYILDYQTYECKYRIERKD